MSQLPPRDSAANPYSSPSEGQAPYLASLAPPTRPVSAVVFGILNIGLGVLGVCGGLFGTIVLLSSKNGAFASPILDAMPDGPVYQAYTFVSMALGLVATVVLLAAGVGLLQFKPWGRTWSIGYAIYAIIAGVIGIVVQILFALGPMLEAAGALPEGPQRAGAIAGAIGGVIGAFIGLAYPAILLFFMLRPSFKAAFESVAEAPR